MDDKELGAGPAYVFAAVYRLERELGADTITAIRRARHALYSYWAEMRDESRRA